MKGMSAAVSKCTQDSNTKLTIRDTSDCRFLLAGFLLDLLLDIEDEGSNFVRNFHELLPNYMALHPRR
jgi:hypothetical protein